MQNIVLSVFIPTYNRPEQILQTINKLIPQIVENVTINILDNHSDRNIKNYCLEKNKEIAVLIDKGSIKFIRNVANIGMSANFMKAFEICESEWMWLISDDDDIYNDAINKILKNVNHIKNEKDISFIKFSSIGCENTDNKQYVSDMNSLIDILSTSKDYFNSFIFLTNGLYHLPDFKSELQIGYKYLNTYVPHLMMLLNSIYNKKKIYLSTDFVAKYIIPKVGYSYGIVAGLGVGAFKNFIYKIDKKTYLKLNKIFAAHNDFKVTIDLYYMAKYKSNLYVAKELSENYYQQIKSSRSLFHNIIYKIFNLSLNIPFIFELIIEIAKFFNYSIEKHVDEILIRYNI